MKNALRLREVSFELPHKKAVIGTIFPNPAEQSHHGNKGLALQSVDLIAGTLARQRPRETAEKVTTDPASPRRWEDDWMLIEAKSLLLPADPVSVEAMTEGL